MDFLPIAWGEYFLSLHLPTSCLHMLTFGGQIHQHELSVGFNPTPHDIRMFKLLRFSLCRVDPMSQVQINPLLFRHFVSILHLSGERLSIQCLPYGQDTQGKMYCVVVWVFEFACV